MSVAVVAIGRNEGERLRQCLQSVVGTSVKVVYVDSGSTDGSVAVARGMGVDVVELDMNIPFTAARARNQGFRRVRETAGNVRYVQFVDGDCEIAGGWIGQAAAFLDGHDNVAAVFGRLRERHPERSVFNMLCDIEWERPVGEVKACGGIAMMRADAVDGAHGFRDDMIAGEEPELCVRLRGAGWRVWNLGEEMGWHDAAMTRFGQWWKRAVRGGYANALGASLHGAAPERHRVRESRSVWWWGLGFPLVVMGLGIAWGPATLGLLLIYPLQVIRLALRGRRSARENWWRAGFIVLGKFPEMLGQLKFFLDRRSGRQAGIIEYK